MKYLKRVVRLCALVLFMTLAVAGIGMFGVAPILSKDRKLFADTESVTEARENTTSGNTIPDDVKF
ncbi:hypothetical protein [Mucilaginibacter xinganensis]|uniref:Uncharacterized protein n=1 Tax=Mucilaginibacter xinganensis TaxID=1234841 RepID=A0A223NZH8_9SPHI|nr:hypothetical protein [Mucilaginibacter xinganensis]ASU35104.1 hypothetical protein MuYL_3219 [Mucilaginibacter xinganensis]